MEDGPLVRERGEKAAGREERRPSQNDLAVRVARNLVGGAKFGVRGAAEHGDDDARTRDCLLYTSPSPRD